MRQDCILPTCSVRARARGVHQWMRASNRRVIFRLARLARGRFGPSRSKSNGLRAGYYTIQSLAESCGSRYLSSSEWGGRVTLQSAKAKAPRQWLVRPKAGSRDYTLTPDWGNTIGGINGNEGENARLSYSKDCGSSSVNLSPKNMLSWTVRHSYRLKLGNTYSIVAAGKAAESKRNRQCPVYLGCIRDGGRDDLFFPASTIHVNQIHIPVCTE
jgi:hypothetical protein